MTDLLPYFLYLPLAGFLLSLMFSGKKENLIFGVAVTTVFAHLIALLTFVVFWISNNAPVLNHKHIVLYRKENIEISFVYFFDSISAVFSLLGALITFLVLIFSKFYLHRDSGFKRFFNTLLFFYFGYQFVIFSGNFETLFVGWEFLGITSFLLIAFYRDRYLPVKNALKTISLYRFGDICMMLALWMNHHLWHQNVSFQTLSDHNLVQSHIQSHYPALLFVLLMLLISASVKSAQFPFSSWLPRAMEGPTTSSAVFYGSLSVHLGVFLLLRTYPYWESVTAIKIIIIAMGTSTAVLANFIASVQSSVKTQIAYSSISQIGIMFVEVALGWHTLALLHLCGNALLRTYQLLVSPSVLNYLIHEQFFSYTPKQYGNRHSFLNKISNSIYILSIKEWNMDHCLKTYLWDPAKWLGKKLYFISGKVQMVVLLVVSISAYFLRPLYREAIPGFSNYLHLFFALLATIFILCAFVERASSLKAWLMLMSSQILVLLSISYANEDYAINEILLYCGALVFAAVAGIVLLWVLKNREPELDLNSFQGHGYEYPKTGFAFLLCCLVFVSLPITPSFIGFDLLFSHIRQHDYPLIAMIAMSFLVFEIAALRIYARVFLGPHIKHYHPIAFRSS